MSQSTTELSRAVQMLESQITQLKAKGELLLKHKREQEGHLKRSDWTSDREMLDLQMASQFSYVARKHAILEVKNEISRVTHAIEINLATIQSYSNDLKDLMKTHQYANVSDFKAEAEYQKACQYLKSKNNQLELSGISKSTVIVKAHEMHNMDLVEKLYFTQQLQKRVKFYHKSSRGLIGCAYKGGKQCNCGLPVGWSVDPNVNWTTAITMDSQEPVGRLKVTESMSN